MKIDLIDNKHIKVELDVKDMMKYGINHKSFCEKTENAREALKHILQSIYKQTGYNVLNTKFLVEIFPTVDDGCVILFTRPNTHKRFRVCNKNSADFFRFSTSTDLIDCMRAAIKYCPNSCVSVFFYKNSFVLYLHNPYTDKALKLLLLEYSIKLKNCRLEFLKEHAKLICENTPISRIVP